MQTAAAPAVANHSSANGRELVDERGGRGVGRLGVGVGGSAPLRAIAAARGHVLQFPRTLGCSPPWCNHSRRDEDRDCPRCKRDGDAGAKPRQKAQQGADGALHRK